VRGELFGGAHRKGGWIQKKMTTRFGGTLHFWKDGETMHGGSKLEVLGSPIRKGRGFHFSSSQGGAVNLLKKLKGGRGVTKGFLGCHLQGKGEKPTQKK